MRPSPDICAKPLPCSPSLDSFDPRTPATFFLSRNPSSDPPSPASEDEHPAETMYGVHSLDESLSQLATSPPPSEHSLHYDLGSPIVRRRSTLKPRESPMSAASRPLTPLNLSTPDEPSLPSSPRSISNHSLRPLDDISITDEINSQPVGSGDEEEGPRTSPRLGPGGASQLIMPSIKMPSRRPFTERGKAMGRFKVLLAGAPGAGKTSLIKSIVQACEDIVHVDSLPPVTAIERWPSRSQPRPTATHRMLSAISEIYASTKPYPSWWSDLEDSRVLRRRKSIGEIVLERNLCFVDTPATSLSRAGQTDAVVQYMRQQLLRATAALSNSGVDFQNLLAGNGCSQVDAIIYLISSDTLAADVECIRKLCELTNVIPVVSKSDTLSPEQITALKDQFHQQARDAGIKPFLFGDPGPGGSEPQPPYAVSSEKTTDLEVMDASTLMSPDYVQPLVSSEMDTLVRKMFDRDNLAWMRHSAAKKLAQHRDGFPSVPPTTAPLLNALSGPSSSEVGWRVASGASMGYSIFSSGGSPPSYAMARLTDITQHEERLAQVGLAQWATNLQRSLQNERDRYAALARADRAVWLTERLSECVVDGSLVPLAQTPEFRGLHIPSSEKNADGVRVVRSRSGEGATEYRIASLGPHDPLGVVGWIDDLGRRGRVLVQIVGSVGVVGGLALWFARTCGLPIRSLAELNLDYWCGSVDR